MATAKLNDLSNSESLCRFDASHQVSAQCNLLFGRCRLKNFKMTSIYGGHLGYLNRTILIILNLYVLQCLPSNFVSKRPVVLEEMSFEEFQDGHYGSHLGYRTKQF